MSDPAEKADASESKPSAEPVPASSGGATASTNGGAGGDGESSWLAQVIPLVKKIELDEDGRIPTVEFLATAARFPEIFDMVFGEGRVSSHLKADVGGNVDFLRKLYEGDKEKFAKLYDYRTDSEGSVKLLWLQRGLMWLFILIRELMAQPNETVSKVAWDTYEATLGKHHNWFVRKFVGVAFGVAPTRKVLLESFRLTEEQLQVEGQQFVVKFSPIILLLNRWLIAEGIEVK